MAYSLTEKLTFAENPKIEIKGKEITVKAEAETVLKLFDLIQNSGEMEATLKAPEIIFSEKDRKIIESLHLGMQDYMTLMTTAMSLATGEDPDEEKESE